MRWLYRGIPCTLALHPFLLFASTPVLPQPKGASSTTAHSHCPCVCLTWSIYELSGAFMLLCEMHMNPRGMGWLLFFSFSFVPKSPKLVHVLRWLYSERAAGMFWKNSRNLFSAVDLEVFGQNRTSITSNLLTPQLGELNQEKFSNFLVSHASWVTEQDRRPLGRRHRPTWWHWLRFKPYKSWIPFIKIKSSIFLVWTRDRRERLNQHS